MYLGRIRLNHNPCDTPWQHFCAARFSTQKIFCKDWWTEYCSWTPQHHSATFGSAVVARKWATSHNMLRGVHLFSLIPHDKRTLIFNACFLNYLEPSPRTPASAASLQHDSSKYCACHWTCERLHLVRLLSSKLSKLAAKAKAKSCTHAMTIERVRFSVADASRIHSYEGDLWFFLRSSSS